MDEEQPNTHGGAPPPATGDPPGPGRLQALTQQVEQYKQELGTEREQRRTVERERDDAVARAQRLEVAARKGIPAELAARLQGKTTEEMEADADALLGHLASKSPPGVPPPTTGGAPAALDITKMSPKEIRDNAARLWEQRTR